ARHTSDAVAGLTRLRDHAAGTAALRAGRRDREEPLLPADLALAAAHRAHRRGGARRRAAAAAGLAGFLPRNLNGGFGALGRLVERDLEVVAEIGPALRTAAPPSAAEEIAEAEHVPEDVGEVAELAEHGRIEPGAGARRRADALVAEPIVEAALL